MNQQIISVLFDDSQPGFGDYTITLMNQKFPSFFVFR